MRFGRWFIDDGLPMIVGKLQEWATAFVDWIGPLIPPFLRRLGDLIAQFANWFIGDGLNMIVTKLGEWAAAFLEWVGPLIPPLLRELVKLLVEVGKWLLTTGLPTIISLLAQWGQALISWIIDVAPDVLSELGTLLADLATALFNGAVDLGKDLIDGMVDGIRAAPGALVDAIKSLIPGGGLFGSIANAAFGAVSSVDYPFRRAGGPVSANMPYIVGESGPELFVPTGAGTIMSNARLGGMGGGDTFNITVNVPTGNGDDVVRALQDYVRRRGSIPVPVGSARY